MPEPWTFHRRPSDLAIHLRALLRARAQRRGVAELPAIEARWPGRRIDPADRAAFRRLAGLADDAAAAIVYPHVVAFPLAMSVLTHPAFPLSLFGALQVRNRVTSHAPLPEGGPVDLRTRVAASRILEKGAEVDLHTTVHAAGDLRWESVITFYYRGRFGVPGAAAPETRPPAVEGETTVSWRALEGGAWEYGRLIGDFNPVHWSSPYARRMGFPRSFLHPHRTLAQGLGRVARPAGPGPERLQAWFRGPVFYGAPVRLSADPREGATVFALRVDGDDRPAVVGRWTA